MTETQRALQKTGYQKALEIKQRSDILINLAKIRDFFLCVFFFLIQKYRPITLWVQVNFESAIEPWRCLFLLIPARFINTNSMVQWPKLRFPTCIMLQPAQQAFQISTQGIRIAFCAIRTRTRYTPNGKFARGPIGETTHVWVTREIRVLWKAIISRIYIYMRMYFVSKIT